MSNIIIPKNTPLRGLISKLSKGEILTKTPGEILLGVALGIEGYDTPAVRTLYRANLHVVENELEIFRNKVLKISGNFPHQVQNYTKVHLKNSMNIYQLILERLMEYNHEHTREIVPHDELKNLEVLLLDKSNSSYLHRKISGEFTFFEPEELIFMESRREKSQERIFYKIGLNLAIAEAIQKGININPDLIELRKTPELTSLNYLKKASIEDFYGMRIICYEKEDIMQYIQNMVNMSQSCDGFRILTHKKFSNIRVEKKYWKDEEALKLDFFQNRKDGYKGWKFKLIKNLSCSNPNLDLSSNRFEVQLYSLPWFLNNEGHPSLNHVAYEKKQNSIIEQFPQSVHTNMDAYTQRLTHFYNETQCYIPER